MPRIHPKTWEDGVMPLEEFPEWKQAEIASLVAGQWPPPRILDSALCQMESRAWWEWHWVRGRKLRYVPGPGRRAIRRAVRRLVIERDGFICGICANEVDPSDVHLDHIVPVSLGGGNDPENLRVTHSLCNIRRGARV